MLPSSLGVEEAWKLDELCVNDSDAAESLSGYEDERKPKKHCEDSFIVCKVYHYRKILTQYSELACHHRCLVQCDFL